jgi:hypothetical protein
MANNWEEKDMDYQIKENVNVNSLTFRKKVLEEAIDLMGVINNYTMTNIEFNLMLGFLDNVIEGNTLLKNLAESTRLVNELEDSIEPLYQNIIVNNENYLSVFNGMLEELKDYCDREVQNNKGMNGIIHTIINELGSLSLEEIMNMINQTVELAANRFVPKTKEQSLKETKPVKTAENIKIENEKILELVNKFANHKNIAE